MECELLLLQPRLLPVWLARFEPSKENAAFRANREARTSHPRLAVCAKCCAWLITDLQCSSLRGRRLKGKGKGVLGAGETPEAREEGGRETPARRPLACVASVSVRFGSKERGTRVKHRAKNGLSKIAGRGFHFLALVSFLARPNPRIPFPGLSLLRNQTETLATQARRPLFFSFLTSTRRMLKSWLVRLLAGVSLPPFLLARFSRFPRAQNPLSIPFQTPATQASGAAELRIAYGIDIVHYRTEGLKCLRLRLLKTATYTQEIPCTSPIIHLVRRFDGLLTLFAPQIVFHLGITAVPRVACTQTLFYFSFRSSRKHRRDREHVRTRKNFPHAGGQ